MCSGQTQFVVACWQVEFKKEGQTKRKALSEVRSMRDRSAVYV